LEEEEDSFSATGRKGKKIKKRAMRPGVRRTAKGEGRDGEKLNQKIQCCGRRASHVTVRGNRKKKIMDGIVWVESCAKTGGE